MPLPEWVRRYSVFWMPRPWPLWMRTIPEEQRPVTLDQIAARMGLAAATIAARLSMLAVEGAIEELPGGRFQRVDRPA